MKKTSIVLLFGIMFLLSIASVSGAEFDNTISYSKSDTMVTIKNLFGMGDTIGVAELKTPIKDNMVLVGKNRIVMEYDFTNFQSGTSLGEVKFVDMKTKQLINKPYHFEKITYTTYESPIYENIGNCELNVEKIVECDNKITGYETVTKMNRETYNLDKVSGDLTLALIVDVEEGESIDGKWTIAGKTLDRHAVWNATKDLDLISYYKFDESAGTGIAYDTLGVNNFTIQLGDFRDGGIINNMLNSTSGDGINGGINATSNLNGMITGSQNRTINFWTKSNGLNDDNSQFIFGWGGTGAHEGFYVYLSSAGGNYYLYDFTGGANSGVAATKAFTMHSVTTNATAQKYYINGVLKTTWNNNILATTATKMLIGSRPDTTLQNYNGTIDELGIWNRTLSASEIVDLYNSGAGLGYQKYISLNSPADNYNTLLTSLLFSANFSYSSSDASSWVNSTLYVWKSDGSLLATNFSVITGLDNSSNLSISNIPIGTGYKWNYRGCLSSHSCSFASQNRTFNINAFTENSQTYNTTVYETAYEGFVVNVTYDNSVYSAITGDLIWNGTTYSGTKSGTGGTVTFSKSININTITSQTNKTFVWQFGLTNSSGINYYNSSWNNQTVNNISLTLCSASPQNVPFVNFTFKDETSDAVIDAKVDASTWTYWLGDGSVTKTLYFSNTTKSNLQYGFCFAPAGKTLNVDLSFKYSNSSYPQRTWTYNDKALTNTTTMQVLYLLGSADGIYTSIQVLSSGGQPIQGVTVQLEREFLGVWTLMEQGITDSSGLVTFWVNPNYDYRITASKTGYVSQQVTIRPSQTTYTMRLSTTGGSSSYSGKTEGIRWLTRPTSGTLRTGTQNFNSTVTSYATIDLEGCKLELLNMTNVSQILATSTAAATNTTYCYTSLSYTVSKGTNLFGRLSIDTDHSSGYFIIDSDSRWIAWDLNASSGNGTSWRPWNQIDSFFDELGSLSEFGDDVNTRDFSRLVFFFLIATLGIGIFTYFSGYELQSPGSGIFIIMCLVLFASAGGFLTMDYSIGSSTSQTKWGFFIMFLFLTMAYGLDIIRRNR